VGNFLSRSLLNFELPIPYNTIGKTMKKEERRRIPDPFMKSDPENLDFQLKKNVGSRRTIP